MWTKVEETNTRVFILIEWKTKTEGKYVKTVTCWFMRWWSLIVFTFLFLRTWISTWNLFIDVKWHFLESTPEGKITRFSQCEIVLADKVSRKFHAEEPTSFTLNLISYECVKRFSRFYVSLVDDKKKITATKKLRRRKIYFSRLKLQFSSYWFFLLREALLKNDFSKS